MLPRMKEVLEYYARPSGFTEGGGYAPALALLPRDIASLALIVQGLLLHRHWAEANGIALSDPSAFGIFDLRGLWFVAGNLLRDLAALNNREMLPWDAWGAMFGADDRVAALIDAPDRNFPPLRALFAEDARLGVGATVCDSRRHRPQPAGLS
jgi:hypothetical protein